MIYFVIDTTVDVPQFLEINFLVVGTSYEDIQAPAESTKNYETMRVASKMTPCSTCKNIEFN